MEASWWNKIKKSLLSYLGESEGYALSTVQLSYDNLPEYLKPCLLYMGMFPEDARLPVSKLISLWIAEGFVQNIESGRLMEEAAEGYLMDLISSNVVMVSRRRYNGKVNDCQVHDVVLHFCLEKSREEKFMLAVKGQFQPSHSNESRVSFSFSNEEGFSYWNPLHQCSKLISKVASRGSKTQKPFPQHLKSLITTNRREFFNWNIFPQVSEMRLLKVLDLSSHRERRFSSATLKPLIHLKYLAVYTKEFDFHPESHLPHLETLIVSGSQKLILLPAIFWKMEKLRHVDIPMAEFDLEGMFEESSKLENLRILRNVNFLIEKVDVLLQRCPNLQEFGITFTQNLKENFAGPFCLKLDSLTQLQSLRLHYRYGLFTELYFLSNLKKLVLLETPIDGPMSFIVGLPSLEYLRFVNIYFKHEEWCLGNITFHKLKFLKLVNVLMSRWGDIPEESFPLLETLVIRECPLLEEIPVSFADITTLKQIKLIWCKESLEASALQIKEAVEENEGCDRIDLITINKYQSWKL